MKLGRIDIRGFVLQSYLSNRGETVKFIKYVSGSLALERRVPQSAVLGPILLNSILYIP
jgi:hypothetical protein